LSTIPIFRDSDLQAECAGAASRAGDADPERATMAADSSAVVRRLTNAPPGELR
jgi:hypothetical protein